LVENPAMDGGVFFVDNWEKNPILDLPMFQELILTCLVGGVVALDETEACQTMLSQPLLIGPIIGLLLHDLPGGILLGILLQLAYLWVMPIGTAVFPDPSIGAVVGTSGFIMLSRLCPNRFNLTLLIMLIFIIPFSLLAGWSLIKQRQLNSRLPPKADLYAEHVNTKKIDHIFFCGLLGSFLRGVVVTCLGMLCVLVVLKPLVEFFSFVPHAYLSNMEIPIWGWGFGTMIYLFGSKRNLLWSIGGVGLGIIIILL
jgi:mannose/fructose/N-acetylgalactosamine-specific phosphotransferase system component IIC